ncbi:MAG: hypothetical protein JWM41_3702 [Gemmatimonadetes bacterium]|nr:hypothetical protein [Gemmatimonadota bacterium]
MLLRTVSRAVLALIAAATLGAQVPASRPPGSNAAPSAAVASDPLHAAGRSVTISLLTMGNGEQVWELFGHAAIWIHDNTTGRDTVFNWGVFDPRQPNFILHFLKGRMLYQMGGDSMNQLLYAYRYFNRTVSSQQLDLTTAQKDSLLHLIQINALPQNRQYLYDYFQNNCSTRPRDLLDQVLGGQLHAASMTVSERSYRWHALRLMQGGKPLVVGVDVGLGEPSDRPATRWQEMFLPKELHDAVATLQVRDSTGATHPLVANEQVLYQSTRPAEPTAPPHLAPWLTAIGVVVAALFAWLGTRAGSGARGARVAAAIAMGLWSFLAGLLGVVLTILWTVTDHIFAHANENLLLFNPLWLVLAVLLPVYYLSGRATRATRAVALVLAGLCAVALLAHLVTLSRQSNLALVGLALPPALAILWAVVNGTQRSPRVSAVITAPATQPVTPRRAT